MIHSEPILEVHQSLRALPAHITEKPKVVFTDVDDTLTYNGTLPVETFQALYRLKEAGIEVIPVTGASAGWCDCLIKTWPIQHIIGENGALSMQKDTTGIVRRYFVKESKVVIEDMEKLQAIAVQLSNTFPEIQYTQDQAFRLTDIAFDIGQAVTVDSQRADQATQWLTTLGVHAKRSSIHINVWIGSHSKASGAVAWLQKNNIKIQDCLFIGDSPNDESMFETFPLSIGVANIKKFIPGMKHLPNYVTKNQGGHGFVDMVNCLLGEA